MNGTQVPARKRMRGEALKRAMDVAAGCVLLLFLAVLLPFAAIAIRMGSPGPVFFRQERLGRGGAPFCVLKLRTMCADAHRLPAPARKTPHDPRITRVGRWLRRTSLDELPQAWNILRGEMSLVGPRPLNEVETRELGPDAWLRLAVKPGLTGLWQVSGRSDLPPERWLALDLEYVREYSLRKDLAILLRTVPAVLTGRGAY